MGVATGASSSSNWPAVSCSDKNPHRDPHRRSRPMYTLGSLRWNPVKQARHDAAGSTVKRATAAARANLTLEAANSLYNRGYLRNISSAKVRHTSKRGIGAVKHQPSDDFRLVMDRRDVKRREATLVPSVRVGTSDKESSNKSVIA
ncbi:hypothetical protein HG530_011137 [Fusarium avenaceum]|nr:hypothetical protein HG530_011137 [Fusarium avenaceum]